MTGILNKSKASIGNYLSLNRYILIAKLSGGIVDEVTYVNIIQPENDLILKRRMVL